MTNRIKRFLPTLFLNMVIVFLGAFIQNGISLGLLSLITLVGFTQIAILMISAYINVLLPIRIIEPSSTTKITKKRNLSKYLSVLIIIGFISLAAGYISLFAALLSLFFYFKDDLKNILFHRQYLKKHLTNIASINAEVCLFISGPAGAAYQVNQWLPVLERLNQKCMIVSRRVGICKRLNKTKIPAIYVRSVHDLEQAFNLNQNLKIVLYPANPMQNAQVLRNLHLQHVFINHGESDKVVNQSKFLLAYDKLFLAGKLSFDRLISSGLEVRDSQVVYVGRPQAEISLIKNTQSIKIKTIFYAPTWEGFVDNANYTSIIMFGLKILKEITTKKPNINLIFKPHPYTGIRSEQTKRALQSILEYCTAHDITVLSENENIHHGMNQCDLLITDISSVLNDFLVTNKPVILCNSLGLSKEQLLQEYPSSHAAYLLNEHDSIISLVKMIDDTDPMSTEREVVRTYSMGSPHESSLQKFQLAIDQLSKLSSARNSTINQNYSLETEGQK